MSTNHGEIHKSHREALLHFMSDCRWHTFAELRHFGGLRYGARLLELKRLGYEFEDKPIDGEPEGKAYRLLSTVRGVPQAKRVKVLLEESDVEWLLENVDTLPRVESALTDALASFRTNKAKL
jgi:hypothetical protein